MRIGGKGQIRWTAVGVEAGGRSKWTEREDKREKKTEERTSKRTPEKDEEVRKKERSTNRTVQVKAEGRRGKR